MNSAEVACSLWYAGRLHRLHDRKKEVVIYDYADIKVPILVKMCRKRWLGDKSIGHDITASLTTG